VDIIEGFFLIGRYRIKTLGNFKLSRKKVLAGKNKNWKLSREWKITLRNALKF
jgi:hypothetical protein